MLRISLILLVMLPVMAHAQLAGNIEGDYEGSGEGNISLRTIVLDTETGMVAASLGVGSRGCGGAFVGTGKLKNNVLKISPYKKEEGAESCIITVTFDKTGKKASVNEDDCMYYHGAACSFNGQLKKKR